MGVIWIMSDQQVWRPTPAVDGPLRSKLDDDTPAMRLAIVGARADACVALLVPPDVAAYVNGRPVVGGLHVLTHRDELLVGGERLYYSAQSAPTLSTFQLAEGATRPKCPTCRKPIEDGQPVVACPQCGRVLHEAGTPDGKNCWTYRAACPCGHPTALDPDSQWRPDQEAGHA